jgi:hypothetical protein
VSFINDIRQGIGHYFYRKDVAKVRRNRKIQNLNNAKTIGLIYDASDEKLHNVVCDFVKYFQENMKIVKAIGYVSYSRLPHYCFPKLSFDYFTRKDLNWYFKPTPQRVQDFINEEYDIVIDLTMKDNFALQYIAGLSHGKFKVGRYSNKYSGIYDFMLDVDENITLEKFIKESIHYLSILNKNPNA